MWDEWNVHKKLNLFGSLSTIPCLELLSAKIVIIEIFYAQIEFNANFVIFYKFT